MLSVLLVALAQPGMALSGRDEDPCDAGDVFPLEYRVECKKEGGLEIVKAYLKKEDGTYETVLDNPPVILMVGNKKNILTRVFPSPHIYTDLMGLPSLEGATSAVISSPIARRKVTHVNWELLDMRVVEYKGNGAPVIVCLTLLNAKAEPAKALLECSEFYDRDILEIRRLEDSIY
jgi:hypothetical protein